MSCADARPIHISPRRQVRDIQHDRREKSLLTESSEYDKAPRIEQMTSEQLMVDLVNAQLAAYNNRDLTAYCESYHPDVIIAHLVTGEIYVRGMDQFRIRYKDLFAKSPHLHCDVVTRVVFDSNLVDVEEVTGWNGSSTTTHFVAVYSFRDGKIGQTSFLRK
jgi:hypothetical protein